MEVEEVNYSIDDFEIGSDKNERISEIFEKSLRNHRTVTFEQQDDIIGDPPSIEARQVNLYIGSQLINNLKNNYQVKSYLVDPYFLFSLIIVLKLQPC